MLQNYALNQLATESSSAYGGDADRAVDGNTDGLFGHNSVTHTDFDANAWWQVDLGRTIQIASIEIWGRTDCCRERLSDFYVLLSNEPFVSTDLQLTLQQPGVVSVSVVGQAQSPQHTLSINGV